MLFQEPFFGVQVIALGAVVFFSIMQFQMFFQVMFMREAVLTAFFSTSVQLVQCVAWFVLF